MDIPKEVKEYFTSQGKKSVESRKAKYGGDIGFNAHMRSIAKIKRGPRSKHVDNPLAD